MRLLVTGASGLLGINLALEVSREGGQDSNQKYTSAAEFGPVNGASVYGQVNQNLLATSEFTVIQADMTSPGSVERLLDQTRPDWVIHCAALANLDACEANPAQARQLNTEVPRQLAQLVARGGARLLHVSTDAIFDGRRGIAEPMYTETDAPNPIGVYSRTKLDGEVAVLENDPTAIVARVNLFGYSLSGKRSLGEFFLYNLQAKKEVMGFTDVFFCPLLANDLARIFFRMLDNRLSGLYHVVSRECLSKYEFGVRIARRFGLDEGLILPVSVTQAGLKAVRSPNLRLSTDKLTQALGAPPPTFADGLEEFHQLYQTGYPQQIKRLAQ